LHRKASGDVGENLVIACQQTFCSFCSFSVVLEHKLDWNSQTMNADVATHFCGTLQAAQRVVVQSCARLASATRRMVVRGSARSDVSVKDSSARKPMGVRC
jgi:uncharacterized membrane protein